MADQRGVDLNLDQLAHCALLPVVTPYIGKLIIAGQYQMIGRRFKTGVELSGGEWQQMVAYREGSDRSV